MSTVVTAVLRQSGSKPAGNQIIAALLESQRRKPAIIIPKAGPPKDNDHVWMAPALVRCFFDQEVIDEVGGIVLLALMTGDDEIEKTVRDARRACEHIFRRNHEPMLLAQALDCINQMHDEGRKIDSQSLKKEIETTFHHGNPLPWHSWNQVRKIFGLPKLATGTAAGKYDWKSREEKLREKRREKRKPRRRRR